MYDILYAIGCYFGWELNINVTENSYSGDIR